jgi:mono/diheme cytochrome c family protein
MSFRILLLIAAALAVTACNDLPGKPGPDPEVPRPEDVLSFKILFKDNCSGCHGADGKGGVSIALSNPTYLAIADDNTIKSTVTGGVHGGGMPAFAQSKGGILTDKQIDAIVSGIRQWGAYGAAGLPPHTASATGEPKHGAEVYSTFCASCHGPDGKGSKTASSIVDPAYLALVTDQYLRTIVIAGRPDLGQPDFRSDVPGHPMAVQDISDVVAWLAKQRTQFPGQPYEAKSQEPRPKSEGQ